MTTPYRSAASAWRLMLAAFAAIVLASCGGSPSPSTVVTDPLQISILPAQATLYSGLPTTFVLSGGTGSYIVASNNQQVVPIAGNVTSRSFTVVPNPVLTETQVTLTVRDTGTTPSVTATLTVRPGTVANEISITPTSTQASTCSPAICSGGDALATVTISQGGIPLAARGVRFAVVSGDYRFITTPPGTATEVLSLTADAVTDETGKARMRIRVLPLAPNQTALLQVTDLGEGAFQRTSFAIVQYTGNTPAFFTLPSSITFKGPYAGTCASSSSADVAVFGGTPPYSIVNSSVAFFASPQVVNASGGRFTVSLLSSPICVENATVAITDATGRTIFVTLSNVEGTGAAPPPPISLFPSALALTCGNSSSLSIVGGSGTYSASVTHPRVTVSVTGNTVTVTRLSGDGATMYPTTATVSVTDGTTRATANLTVPANCATAPIALSTNTVTLTCGTSTAVTISGGTGAYFPISTVSQVFATIVGNVLTITRLTGDGATTYPSPAIVLVSDGFSNGAVTVTHPANCP